MLATFAAGIYVQTTEVFPHGVISSATKTATTLFERATAPPLLLSRWKNFVNVAPVSVAAHRFELFDSDELIDPILVAGERGRFAEYCPDSPGCLAVEYAGAGKVVHAYPWRPDEIEKTNIVADFPYEHLPGFSFEDDAEVFGISRYSNGDLLVIFRFRFSYPHGGGMARIDADGRPIWYRRDYSHHWPYVNDDDIALVPAERAVPPRFSVNIARRTIEWDCERPNFDIVQIVDGKGQLLEEISLFDAVLESPYAPLLNPPHCRPIYLNFVHQLGEDAKGGDSIGPGDMVVSIKRLNAFGILDRDDRRLKRLVRGSFFGQHSVQHLKGSKFVLFDNWGGDGVRGPSRVLMVDLADGKETTIFPNDETPEHLRSLFTYARGNISISPDRSRLIVVFHAEGKAVEVRIADGEVLTVFNNVHDVSQLDQFSEKRTAQARLSSLSGMYYIDRNEK